MQIIEIALLYHKPDKFRIYPLGDIHSGCVQCAEQKIKDKVAQIASEPNSYFINMGDDADCIIENDPRWNNLLIAPWVEKDNIVSSEEKFVTNLFEPIAPRCLAWIDGNHELRIRHFQNHNFTRNVMKNLNIPEERYGGYQCLLRIVFKRENSNERHELMIHAWHGAGSAVTDGARLMRLKRLVNEIEADVYLMGHLHGLTVNITDKLTLRNHRLKSKPIISAITGSWLKSYMPSISPNYIEEKGYPPAHIGCPVIEYKPQTNELTCTIESED